MVNSDIDKTFKLYTVKTYIYVFYTSVFCLKDFWM